jgi:8-oxo-dGTP pyrophosphatase MutT (NUDIX family)
LSRRTSSRCPWSSRTAANGNWELPGGQVEVGDTATGALQREVTEEAGIMIEIFDVSGVYTEPGYVIRSSAGRVRNHSPSASTPPRARQPATTSRSHRDQRRHLGRRGKA